MDTLIRGYSEPKGFIAESCLQAEARSRRSRSHRAGRQSVRRGQIVVGGRCDVIRRPGMKERRQVLHLAAARAELKLPTGIRADAVLGTVVVRRTQLPEGTEA